MQTVKLNNGIEMPILGYGVFLVRLKNPELKGKNFFLLQKSG